MQIERLLEWDMTPAIEKDIAALIAQGFPDGFDGRSYHQQRHQIRFVARDHGAVLGHMALRYQDVRLGGALTSIWGLAEVVTAPKARGQGIATQLLQAAIAFAKSTPAAFFVLFGDRPIYAAHGFEPQGNVMTYPDLSNAQTNVIKTTKNADLMVLPLGDETWDGAANLDLLGHKF